MMPETNLLLFGEESRAVSDTSNSHMTTIQEQKDTTVRLVNFSMER